MPKGQNLYKSLAIFSWLLLIFTVLAIGAQAQLNTYTKVQGDELSAENWNQLSTDFLFKNKNIGQEIEGYLAIGGAPLNSSYDINIGGDINVLGSVNADEFLGDFLASNVIPGEFGSTSSSPGGNYSFPAYLSIGTNLGIGVEPALTSLEIRGTKDVNAGLNLLSNYYLAITDTSNTNNRGSGIAFSSTSNVDSNVGAAIVFERTGSNSQGELQFYTKSSTTGGVSPVKRMVINNAGNLGLQIPNPTYLLHVGNGSTYFTNPISVADPVDDRDAVNKSWFLENLDGAIYWDRNDNDIFPIDLDYNVGIGTDEPNAMLDVNGLVRIKNLQLYATSSSFNLSGGDIGGANLITANKINVGTIDPLYEINGINYSTFASSIVGGVKEEAIGKVKIENRNDLGEFEYIIDFKREEEGSDLWVWYKTIDFKRENVDVLITNYGQFAQSYYLIEDEKIIFRSDRPVEISYRLIAKRFDWKNWPTKARNQNEVPNFIIK